MDFKKLEGTSCPICEKGKLVIRTGSYGKFMGCNAFPRCTFNIGHDDGDLETAILRYRLKLGIANILTNGSIQEGKTPIEKGTEIDLGALDGKGCPICKEGELVIRNGAYGKFVGCDNFPKCKFNAGHNDLDLESAILRNGGKIAKPSKPEDAVENIYNAQVRRHKSYPPFDERYDDFDNTFDYIEMATGISVDDELWGLGCWD